MNQSAADRSAVLQTSWRRNWRRSRTSIALLTVLGVALPNPESTLAAEPSDLSEAASIFRPSTPPAAPSGPRRGTPTLDQVERAETIGALELTHWPTELALKSMQPLLNRFFNAMQAGGIERATLTEAFTGNAPLDPAQKTTESTGISVLRWRTGDPVSVADFIDRWEAHLAGYQRVIRTEHHVVAMQPTPAGDYRLQIPFRITGTTTSGLREDQGTFTLLLTAGQAANGWRIRKLSVNALVTLSAPSIFAAQPLMVPPPPINTPVTAFVDYFAEGVSLADLDRDGDLEIFAGQRHGRPLVFDNRGDGNFAEVGAQLGLTAPAGVRSGYFFDWDNDGDLDGLLLTATRMYLFEQHENRFRDISEASNFQWMSTSGLTGAAIGDYNADGLLDFYVCNYGDPARGPNTDYFESRKGYQNLLFSNAGDGRFVDVTESLGLHENNDRWTYAAAFHDFDNDGRQDIYVVNDYGPNQLFRNIGAEGFADTTAAARLEDPGNGMSVSLGDLNGDGRLDVYVSNMKSYAGLRMIQGPDFPGTTSGKAIAARFAKGNTLHLKEANGRYQEATGNAVEDAKWAWGSAMLDHDNDGDLDLYVANGMFSNHMRRDADPVFWRHLIAPISNGTPPPPLQSAYFADLIQQWSWSFAGFERNRLFQNLGAGEFVDVAAVAGADLVTDSRSVASGDLDADGDLDLVVSSLNEPRLAILWNRGVPQGHHLRVTLEGSPSNRQGVGSRIELQCGERVIVTTVQIASGYLSQSDTAVWLGTGSCERASRLEVSWPSGAKTLRTDVPISGDIRISENAASESP